MARILAVEDNEKNRRLLRMLLASDGHEVVEAADGEAALERAQEERPDLVIMDLQLPKLDGFEVTRRLKADTRLRDVPVLAVSAYAMASDRERGLAAGCDAYLSKPIDTRGLLRTVREMLQAAAGKGSGGEAVDPGGGTPAPGGAAVP